MSEIPKLNYAPRPPMYRRRVFRWWFYVVVLFGVAASGWWWVPPARRRVELLYWQHRCLVYTPPTDQVIYDLRISSGVIPEEWTKFYTLFSPPGFWSDGTIFMHEMKKPNGQSRLVVLDLFFFKTDARLVPEIRARVLKPGNAFRPPVQANRYDPDCDLESDYIGPSKIFAGILDPADASHLTIRVTAAAKDVIYDGWLQNDDSVTIGRRKSPTTRK